MKKSELSNLIQQYNIMKTKLGKSYDPRLESKLKEIEHRYYHETGENLNQK